MSTKDWNSERVSNPLRPANKTPQTDPGHHRRGLNSLETKASKNSKFKHIIPGIQVKKATKTINSKRKTIQKQ